ncbi:hypothetical protein SANA_28350 [Gottschalkiaceae bacterium SANA]|nr:hypothetical protein SANA_28350 [Gottschalkiaceae bacterium SANA]
MNTILRTKEVIEALQDLDFNTIETKEMAKCRSELRGYMEDFADEINQANKQNDLIQLAELEEARQEIRALYEKTDTKSVREYERFNKMIMTIVVLVVLAVMVLLGLVGSRLLDGGAVEGASILPSEEAGEFVDEFPYLHFTFEEVVNEFGHEYEVVNHEGGLFMVYEDELIPYAFGFVSLEANSQVITIILHKGAQYGDVRIGMALPVVIDMLGEPDSAAVNEMDGGYTTKYVHEDYTIEFISDDEKSLVDAAVIRKFSFK